MTRKLKFAASLMVLVSLLFIGACTKEDACKELAAENDVLKEATANSSAQLEEVLATLNEVEGGLSEIEKSQTDLKSIKDRTGEEQKQRIAEMLVNIQGISDANKDRLDKLEKRLKRSKVKSKSLEKLITKLRNQIAERDNQIAELKNSVDGLSEKVAELTAATEQKDAEIEAKNQEINATTSKLAEKETQLATAYFVIGTKKDLESSGVITKEGGVLGLGKTAKLSSKLDKSRFRSLNIKETPSLTIGVSKKPKMLSTHPEGSYNITDDNGIKTLQITDAEQFWSVSKYLVILTD